MVQLKNILKKFGLKKKNDPEFLIISGENDFLENYNKGFFLIPSSIIDNKKSPNRKFTFNKYRNGFHKINEDHYFEEMNFYVCKNLEELNLLYKFKKVK